MFHSCLCMCCSSLLNVVFSFQMKPEISISLCFIYVRLLDPEILTANHPESRGDPHFLVMAPTRELAVQIEEEAVKFGRRVLGVLDVDG